MHCVYLVLWPHRALCGRFYAPYDCVICSCFPQQSSRFFTGKYTEIMDGLPEQMKEGDVLKENQTVKHHSPY